MKQDYFYLLILYFGFSFSNCGTTKPTQATANGTQTIDTAHHKITYHLKFLRDSINMTFKEDFNIVQIGANFTKNYCYQTFHADSLWYDTNGGQQIIIDRMMEAAKNKNSDVGIFSKGIYKFYIYKDYQKAKITVTDHVSSYPFIYDDELKPQDWTVLEDTMSILGYSCQKAVCSYRGRDWEAWFAPDIPISEGPYKFYGLPGLIMKLDDTESHYSFVMQGIEHVYEPIYMTVSNSYRSIDRLSFLKLLMNKTGTDLVAIESARIGITVDNSIMQWDYIERDYK